MKKPHILFVDDDKMIRDTMTLVLDRAGYEVATAEDGFDALLQLSGPTLPELVVSDLNMPRMSGFELLSVIRRRFPQISVVATSGAYETGDAVPGGVIADAFCAKRGAGPSALLKTIAELLATSGERHGEHQSRSAPVWIPRNGKDSKGIPFIVITCTQCLRSFPLSVVHEDLQEVQETPCMFCRNKVRYVVDFSRDVSSPDAIRPSGTSPSSRAMTA